MARGQAEMPFLDHLEELRWRLIWSLVALAVLSVAGFFLVTGLDVIGILERPLRQVLPGRDLLYTSPTTPMVITMKLGFIVGGILALPIIAYHVWAFLSPALYERERRLAVPAIAVGFLLFLAGIALAYFLVLPVGLRFLLGFQEESLSPIITVGEYLRFATRLILACGAVFEMPVLLVLLAMIGVVNAQTLRHYRRHAYIVLAIGAAVLSPPDVITMIMLLVPLVLLYELSVWLVTLVVRRGSAAADRGERRGSGPPAGEPARGAADG